MYTSGFYTWDRRALKFVGSPSNTMSRSSPAHHFSDVGTDEIRDVEMVEALDDSVDKDFLGRKGLVFYFDWREYDQKETRFLIFQVSEMTNVLPAVSKNHKDDLMEDLECHNYQYGVGFITDANRVSDRFSAVKVDDMFERRGTEGFLSKTSRSLSTAVATLALVLKSLHTLASAEPSELYSPWNDSCRSPWLPVFSRL